MRLNVAHSLYRRARQYNAPVRQTRSDIVIAYRSHYHRVRVALARRACFSHLTHSAPGITRVPAAPRRAYRMALPLTPWRADVKFYLPGNRRRGYL